MNESSSFPKMHLNRVLCMVCFFLQRFYIFLKQNDILIIKKKIERKIQLKFESFKTIYYFLLFQRLVSDK